MYKYCFLVFWKIGGKMKIFNHTKFLGKFDMFSDENTL